jgi:hypothetical protein
MAQQTVKFMIPKRSLGNRDIKLFPRWNGKLLGTLLVSRGGIEWRRYKGKRRTRLNWWKFAKVIQGSD